jgi:hypothetical protein
MNCPVLLATKIKASIETAVNIQFGDGEYSDGPGMNGYLLSSPES